MLGEACEKCKLYEQGCLNPFLMGSGSEDPLIVFVGEAPGAQEDEQQEFFIGPSGSILRNAIEVMEIDPEDYRFENVIRCRPPQNRDPKKAEMDHCSTFLLSELERMRPKVVVLLGNVPLRAVLRESGITSWNGAVIEKGDITYIPAFHPSYILRNGGFGTKNLNAELLKQWMDALERAADIAYGDVDEQPKYPHELIYPHAVDDVRAMVEELIEFDDLIACDVESSNLDTSDPNNRILTIAFANSEAAWSFPLDHKEAWWTPAERQEIIKLIAQVLTEPYVTISTQWGDVHRSKIITHSKFDGKIIRAKLGIDFRQYGDTIHLSKLLYSHYNEHGLKRLAGIELDMYDYDKELNDYKAEHPEADYKHGGSYENVPLDTLLPYGNLDVIATWMLHDKLYPQLTEQQQHLYFEMQVPADRMLGVIEENGFKRDEWVISRYDKIYSVLKNKMYPLLLQDRDVQTFVRGKQGELDEDWERRQAKSSRELKRQYFTFNPNSSVHMSEVLYELKKYPVPGHTATGKPSIKKELLKEVLFDFQAEGKDTTFLERYMYWKLLSSIQSKTFGAMKDKSRDWWSPDGKSHSTYGLNDAKTGRLASSKPNLQNIPTVEKEPGTVLQYLPIKNAFTHSYPEGCLCMVDYAGMELRVMCSVAGIQGMVDVFSRGGDVHRYTSSLIYSKPEAEIDKFERYRGKWCNWSLLYLGNWWTLYRLYRINGLTMDEAKRVTKVYFKAFPELKVYHKTKIAELEKYGYVTSPFGRILRIPSIYSEIEGIKKDAQRTGVNMPIQGTASDVLMIASVVIEFFMRQRNMKSLIVNTVHDSLVGDVHPDELETWPALCVDVMENVVDYAAEFMPHIKFDWLKVPLKADVDMGSHYGSYGDIPSNGVVWNFDKLAHDNILWNSNTITERFPRVTQKA